MSCRGKGEGTNIPEGKVCIGLSPQSTCAAGLFCDTSRSYVVRRDANTYVKYGLCTKMKNVEEACTDAGECLPPGMCDLRYDPRTGKTDGVCRNP